VAVEAYSLRCAGDDVLAYRYASGPLRVSESPDIAAARISGADLADPLLPVIVHSTSWRHLSDGTIVLTYIVASDPQPAQPAVPVLNLDIARGPDSRHPTPTEIQSEHVAAHAIRHLAFIADTDPQVSMALTAWPRLRAALACLPRHPAGQLPGTATS